MAYLGNSPKGNLLTMNSSQFSGDNSETNFTLSQTVSNTNEVEVLWEMFVKTLTQLTQYLVAQL